MGAIEAYNRLARMTIGKDPMTYSIATELLADEVRREGSEDAQVSTLPVAGSRAGLHVADGA